ncbi:hypothetical protein RHMOL_Rhmol10G0061300 [Rhododendron molle]|uniref:Uncharacterized protein n=1 Tax=Rhododendron molle TaxID=49168 RepID=A0ACC0M002_RHOML|nr:hypothetical protein RHMOL_Rhmol10G0061300 [Rhododendron molle]
MTGMYTFMYHHSYLLVLLLYSLRPFFRVRYSILGCPLISVYFEKLVGKSW